MRQWTIAILVLGLVALTQAFFLPYFRVLGVRVDLMMPVLIAWAFTRGLDEAMVVVPLGGFMVSFVSQEPLGASLLAYAPILPLALVREFNAIGSDYLLVAAVALVATFVQTFIYVATLDATGYQPDWSQAFVDVAIPSAFINIVTSVLAVWILSRFSQQRPGLPAGLTFSRRRTRRLEFR
jgi:rod shape-determining protein MreD